MGQVAIYHEVIAGTEGESPEKFLEWLLYLWETLHNIVQ